MITSPNTSDLTILTCICVKFVTIEVFSHSPAEGEMSVQFPTCLNSNITQLGLVHQNWRVIGKETQNLQYKADGTESVFISKKQLGCSVSAIAR